MPRLHPITGLAACGTAGGRVSYGARPGEAVVLCDGGCTHWLNPDEIAYLGPLSGSWGDMATGTAPQAVHIHTGARRALEAVPEGVQRRDAAFLAAAAGRWQAGQAGAAGGTFGACGERVGGGLSRASTDARGAAGPDGTIALVDSYQEGGQGFRLARPDGSISDRIADGADQYNLTVLDAYRAIWPAGQRWGTYGLPAPLWIPGSGRACVVALAGVVYLVHWLEGIGLVARRADSSRGTVLAREDREFHYDAIAWQDRIRIAWATADGEPPGSLVIADWDGFSDLEELAPPAPRPTFVFTHPVSVYPFKAEGSGRPDIFTLGHYTESPEPPAPLPAGLRVVLAHDDAGDWTIPAASLRPFDLVLWELYRVAGESLAASVARWDRQTRANLAQWPHDCGVIPMFYCQGGAPPNELWTVDAVLAGLEYLDQIVNLSPRIKVIAPFAYNRANGIIAHPELGEAFDECVEAADVAGEAVLTPIPKPDPPKPDPTPPHVRTLRKVHPMEIDGKVVQLRGAGLRLIAPDAPGTGIWKEIDGKPTQWRGVLYVADGGSSTRYRAKKIPGDRYVFTNIDHQCVAGADGGQYSTGLDRQGYHKPTGDTDAGDLEQWRVYEGNEAGTIQAQIEQTSDANHPAGPGKKIVIFPLTVEIVE